jgi:hypothetical protein
MLGLQARKSKTEKKLENLLYISKRWLQLRQGLGNNHMASSFVTSV